MEMNSRVSDFEKENILANLKEIITWIVQVSDAYDLDKSDHFTRIHSKDFQQAALSYFVSELYRNRPKIRSIRGLNQYMGKMIGNLKAWDKRNGQREHISAIDEVLNFLMNTGVDKRLAQDVASLVLVSLKMKNIDLKPNICASSKEEVKNSFTYCFRSRLLNAQERTKSPIL